jgi:hypothetical protein
MNVGVLKIAAGVDRRVLAPQMSLVEQEAPRSFEKYGHDCWMTSAYRPGSEKSLHGFGFAEDFDSSTNVAYGVGKKIERDVQYKLGPQYQVIWHKTKAGRWHLHVEFDPGGAGIQIFHKRFREGVFV